MSAQSVPLPTQPKKRSRIQRRNMLYFWLFVGPMFLGVVIFIFVPIIWGFILSFFEAHYTVTPTKFVGLENYIFMFKDPAFIRSLNTFFVFAIFIVPTTFVISLGMALLVNNVSKGKGIFRTIFFLPVACSYVVASLVWRMSLFSNLPFGFANLILGYFGINPVEWIGQVYPPTYWVVLVTCRLWLQVGFYMLLFLAGLQGIDPTLYEAAYVDGAKPGWQTFRWITFPLLRNTSISVILLNIIAAFLAFDEFFNILSTGVGSSANITLARPPLVYLYYVALSDQNYGRGAAGAMILFAIILVVTVVQGRLFGFGGKES